MSMLRFRHGIGVLSLLALLGACRAPMPVSAPAGRPALRLKLEVPFRVLSASQPEQVVTLRFCLIEHSTGVSPAGDVPVQPVGTVFSYSPDHPPPLELSFSNLRANGAGKSYSLAVAALDAQDNNITNATGSNASQQRVRIVGEAGNFSLSSSGGDSENPGTVRVEPGSYELTGDTSLGVELKLLDG